MLPFSYTAFLAFPIAALVWFGLHEPNPGGEGESWKQYFSTLGRIVKKKGVSLFVAFLIGFLALSILFGFLSYLSDILEQRFHLQGVVKGLALASSRWSNGRYLLWHRCFLGRSGSTC